MRIDEIIASVQPCFSVEFFPPKTDEGRELLLDNARELSVLDPAFVSVTYGAGGSTRDGTVEISSLLHNELDLETMTHLSCVGETADGLREVLDRIEAAELLRRGLRHGPPRL